MEIYNSTWIGATLNVVESSDSTLVGRSGVVLHETKNTLALDDSDVVIQGALVGQRPEDRTHRKYRKA